MDVGYGHAVRVPLEKMLALAVFKLLSIVKVVSEKVTLLGPLLLLHSPLLLRGLAYCSH